METLDHESCIQEVDTLKAIFEDDLQIDETESGRPECLTIKILPATGDDRSKQYVCLTLQLRLPPAYPLEPPEISVKNPRGLSDEEISSLLEDMRSLAMERSGSPVLYEIIEMAKDCLTEGNIPHCPCAICLDHFVEGDVFTKTDCYHYFHKACLWSYYQHAQRQTEEANIEAVAHQQEPQPFKLLCPTCRFELGEVDEDDLESSPPPVGGTEVSALTPEVRLRQAEMAERFKEQQKKGGVIDLEAERSKYLVSADTVVVINHNPNPQNFRPTGKQGDAAKESQDNQTVKPPQDLPCRGSVRGQQYSTGHDNRGQGTSDHDLRGQDSSGYGSRGQDSRSHEGRGQDYRGQDDRTRENRSHANRHQDHRSHGYRRNWRGSGYYDEDYVQGNRDHYYERDGNSPRWQDDQARPQGRWNNRNNRYKMPERNGDVHQAFDCRQSLDSHIREPDGMHPKVDKENMRVDDRNKEENPSTSQSQEERGHRNADGRGSGRYRRNRRNRQHRPHDRQETDPQQERPNSGGKHGNANRNRNRPTHSELKQDSQSIKSVEVEPSKKDDASLLSEPKQDADISKEGTSPRAESGQVPSGTNDGSQESKPSRQGQRHRRRGGRQNRRTSECDDDPHNHHTEGDRDHERKLHPREFRGRKSSDTQETDSAQARDGDDEGKSKRREHHEKRRGGRGNQQSHEKPQYQDSREGEKESHAKVQYHQREMEGGQRHQKTRDGRGSHQGNEDHQLHHRHEYYGRGRGHYRHRGSRDFDDYHDDGMVHGRGQDERGSEIRDHRGKENRRDQGIDGRGRGYHRRDYGRRRGESYTKHENDKVSPRENSSTEPSAGERKENTEKSRGAGPRLHAEKSSEKGISEPVGEPSTALPSSAGVESADSQPRRPPGFTATGVRPPPGFRGKSTVSPPPGFSKPPSSSAD